MISFTLQTHYNQIKEGSKEGSKENIIQRANLHQKQAGKKEGRKGKKENGSEGRNGRARGLLTFSTGFRVLLKIKSIRTSTTESILLRRQQTQM